MQRGIEKYKENQKKTCVYCESAENRSSECIQTTELDDRKKILSDKKLLQLHWFIPQNIRMNKLQEVVHHVVVVEFEGIKCLIGHRSREDICIFNFHKLFKEGVLCKRHEMY